MSKIEKIAPNQEFSGEEKINIESVIDQIPDLYTNFDLDKNVKAYLRFTDGDADHYVIEHDGEGSMRTFGKSDKYQGLSDDTLFSDMLGELKLDPNFTPKTLGEIEVKGNPHFTGEVKTEVIDEEKKPTLIVAPDADQDPQELQLAQDNIAGTADEGLADGHLQNADASSGEKPYIPASEVCQTLETIIPNSMRFETFKALQTVDRRVNGIDEYVALKLGYIKKEHNEDQYKQGMEDLCIALSAEQVDAVALAIYNIEEKGEAVIVADQTGVGKGRIAAAIMRYGVLAGKKPVFLSEKPNLFSDIYRDLIAIGSDDGIPISRFEGYKEVAVESDIEEDEDEDLMDERDEGEIAQVGVKLVPIYKKNKNYNSDVAKAKHMMRPFIVNGRSAKTDILDSDKNLIYQGDTTLVKKVLKSKDYEAALKDFDCVLATYSQFNKIGDKQKFLAKFAVDNILVMDESHTAGGGTGAKVSTTSMFFRNILGRTKGVTFLSATFAKSPMNMPIYAQKTSIKETGMNDMMLTEAFRKGGVALQEITASQLTGEGQLIRRERSYEGIKVNYRYLDASQTEIGLPQYDLKDQHEQVSDQIMALYREIIKFQRQFIKGFVNDKHSEITDFVKTMQKDGLERLVMKYGISPSQAAMAEENWKKANGMTQSKKDWSKAAQRAITAAFFQFIGQFFFSLKAEAVAEIAIDKMKNGKKPFIAFSATMEAFLNNLKDEDGKPYDIGDVIPFDFNTVLLNVLQKTLFYVERHPLHFKDYGDTDLQRLAGRRIYIDLEQDISADAKRAYDELASRIINTFTGIKNSPIDVVKEKIEKAGFIVQEVTGRNRAVTQVSETEARLIPLKQGRTNEIFQKFNDNEIDCLLVNQVGAVGASAHAIETSKVKFDPTYNENDQLVPPTSLEPRDEVKQRCMLILQAELDINKEVQKRGRINRTGQKYLPEYEYISTSIPAEQRLMMMLQRKLKSLDANTTSNQKQSSSIMDITEANQEDFLNKFGDEVVAKWIEMSAENLELNEAIGSPVPTDKGKASTTDAAYKFTGKVGIARVEDQETFFEEINDNYRTFIATKKELGEYDLEVELLDLQAETQEKFPAIISKGGSSVFGKDAMIEKCKVKPLKKPYTRARLAQEIDNSLTIDYPDGSSQKFTADQLKEYHLKKMNEFIAAYKEEKAAEIRAKYQLKIDNAAEEEAISSIEDPEKKQTALESRIAQYKESMENVVANTHKSLDHNVQKINRWLKNFKIGDALAYPDLDYSMSKEWSKAVVIGYKFNENEKNPYVPSKIKIKFAIASSQVSIELPLSNEEILNSVVWKINQQTPAMSSYEKEYVVSNWDTHTEKLRSESAIRYIITGNLLLAIANDEFKGGKLIKYTLKDGGHREGILLPEKFDPAVETASGKRFRIYVPIAKTKDVMRNLPVGQAVETDGTNFKFTIYRNFNGYKLVWNPTSKRTQSARKGIESETDFFDFAVQKNEDGSVALNQFGEPKFVGYKKSDKGIQFNYDGTDYFITIPTDNINDALDYMNEKHNLNLGLSIYQYEQIKDSLEINLVEDKDAKEINALHELLLKKEVEYFERRDRDREILRERSEGEKDEIIEDQQKKLNEADVIIRKDAVKAKIIKAVRMLEKEATKKMALGGVLTDHQKGDIILYKGDRGETLSGRIARITDQGDYVVESGSGIRLIEEDEIIEDVERDSGFLFDDELSEYEKAELKNMKQAFSHDKAMSIIDSTLPHSKRKVAKDYYNSL